MRTFLMLLLVLCGSLPVGAQQAEVASAQEDAEAIAAKDEKTAAQAVEPTKLDFDVIPGDAMGAIAFRNLSEFKRRAVDFAKKTDGQFSMVLSFVAGFGESFLRDTLGLRDSLNVNGAAAMVGFKPEGNSYAFVLPITDISTAAKAFEVDANHLQNGRLIKIDERVWFNEGEWIGANAKYLALGTRTAVTRSVKAKGLSQALKQETQRVYEDDDIFMTFNSVELQKWLDDGNASGSSILSIFPDEIVQLSRDGGLNRFCAGVRIDEGLDGTATLEFEGDEARKALAKLQSKSGKCNLNGLPVGNIVFATSRSSGPESGQFLRQGFDYITSDAGWFFGLGNALSPQIAAGLIGFVDEGLQRANVSRAALYRNDGDARQGDFCLIGILDTEDGEDFVKEIRDLVPLFNASLHPDDDLKDDVDPKAIDKMIGFLTNKNPRAREFMIAKLRLLGRHALPALRKAHESDDLLLKGRAALVMDDIHSDLADERSEFLSDKFASMLQPDFGYVRDFEQRGGRSIDAIHLSLESPDEKITPQLKAMLGPSWNKLRITNIGNQIVLMLGSNTQLYDKTLENIRAKSGGLQDVKHFADFHAQQPGEMMTEIHVSLANVVQLTGQADIDLTNIPANTPTSLGLSVSPQQLRFDFWIPISEFNAIRKVWD